MRDEESKFGILCVCTSCEDSPWGSITGLWLDELEADPQSIQRASMTLPTWKKDSYSCRTKLYKEKWNQRDLLKMFLIVIIDRSMLVFFYVEDMDACCVAAICHGPIGLLRCHHNGKPLLKDKFIAAFSNEEESLLGLDSVLPFLVETLMDEVGAVCVPSSPWNPNAVVDGRLVTGQNPQSSLEVAHRVLDVLRSLGPKFSPPENANKPWGS
eukprot:gene36987-48267_t